MAALRQGKCCLLGLLLVSFLTPNSLGATAPPNVLVLYNAASPDGFELANYYAQVHPGVQLLGLIGIGTAEDISADDYLNLLRPQILPALNSSINMIVTTKGLPLRIDVAESNPVTYTDPFGVTRTVLSGWWKPYASLESSLTRIEQISTWQQIGDHTYFSADGKPDYPQPACNPYYGVTASFDYRSYLKPGYGGMRLTSRLDGFTTSDVEIAINKAQKAIISLASSGVVMDDDPAAGYDRMVQLKDNVLTPRSQAYLYDNTSAAITAAPGAVIGYVSHGIHGGELNPGYITNQLDFTLACGAVFDTHESYNAYSFQSGGNVAGQGLVAEWLKIGGTAGVGNVQEPFSGPAYEACEDQIFKMLLKGYTWADAAWSSLPQLGYVNTVVGDPLMVWRHALDMHDLSSVLSNYDKSCLPWGPGDYTGDGRVNISDLAVILTQYDEGNGTAAVGAISVPEPSCLALFGVGAVILGSVPICGRRKRRVVGSWLIRGSTLVVQRRLIVIGHYPDCGTWELRSTVIWITTKTCGNVAPTRSQYVYRG
jgi:uncharacterized protein (TIGR03790 family)